MIDADAAMLALRLAWAQQPAPQADVSVLFLGAQPVSEWTDAANPRWMRVQPFKPLADALLVRGLIAQPEATPDMCAQRVLLRAPRQRQWSRALLAQAVRAAQDGGVVLAVACNDEGARSLQTDLAALAGPLQSLSKRHARALWTAPLDAAKVDAATLHAWLELDAPALNRAGYVSRAGLFSSDRIDAGSALLAEALPADLCGAVADLGAGWGYLACAALARCPGIARIDLYEADARALAPARENLVRLHPERPAELHWHDVTRGLPHCYDAVLCNPPFHTGRADQPELGQAFIGAAAAGLHARGRLWLVANRHLPYEATLRERFARVQALREAHGYKVLVAEAPCA